MAAKSANGSSELLQILILTLFITGGFLAVACLVFMFLIPGQKQKADAAQNDLKNLIVSLKSKETIEQRKKYLAFKEDADSQRSLREILLGQKGPLDFSTFNSQKPKQEKGTITYTQPVAIREAPLQNLVDFIARVRTAENSVSTAKIVLNRKSRRSTAFIAEPGETPMWNADLTFVMSRNEEIIKKYLPKKSDTNTQ